MSTMKLPGGNGPGRRSVDAELMLVPMIDLLVCCLTFLLLTATWSQLKRLPAEAQLAGGHNTCGDHEPSPQLSVELRAGEPFHLVWRQGRAMVSETTVPRAPVMVQLHGRELVTYPALATALQREWDASGTHRQADRRRDVAVVRAPDRERFGELTAVMDAVAGVSRGGTGRAQAFDVVLASD